MRFRSLVFVAVAVVALAATASASAAPVEGVRAGLSVDKWRFESSEEISVTYSLTNTTARSVLVLRWDTPVDGIEADILRVERDGQPVTYIGKLVKRAVPELDDYLELQPGETMTFTFDPSTAYDMSEPGRYALRFRGGERRQARVMPWDTGEAATAADPSEAREVFLYFAGREPRRDLAPENVVGALGKPGSGGKYTRCTVEQQSVLVKAEGNATTRSLKALNYLNTGNSTNDSGGLYKTWFDNTGLYSPLYGWSAVTNHFSTISKAFSEGLATYNCGCNQNYYAYVYPSKPYTIYVCKVFWKASDDNYPDTKAGTLIHEMSHFNATAGTDDWAYGTANAKNFANTDPARATTNADNHEYFAETQK